MSESILERNAREALEDAPAELARILAAAPERRAGVVMESCCCCYKPPTELALARIFLYLDRLQTVQACAAELVSTIPGDTELRARNLLAALANVGEP